MRAFFLGIVVVVAGCGLLDRDEVGTTGDGATGGDGDGDDAPSVGDGDGSGGTSGDGDGDSSAPSGGQGGAPDEPSGSGGVVEEPDPLDACEPLAEIETLGPIELAEMEVRDLGTLRFNHDWYLAVYSDYDGEPFNCSFTADSAVMSQTLPQPFYVRRGFDASKDVPLELRAPTACTFHEVSFQPFGPAFVENEDECRELFLEQTGYEE